MELTIYLKKFILQPHYFNEFLTERETYMMKDLPIIALDFESKEKVNQFLDLFDESLFVKVGMELFYQEGPQLINEIKEKRL